MRILQNVTQKEMDFYTRQPTAKLLKERVMKDGVYVGSRDAAEISEEARSLQETRGNRAEELDTMDWLSVTGKDNGKFIAHFNSASQIAAILEKGYLVIEGRKVTLDKQQWKALSAAGKAMEKDQQAVANTMMMEQQVANARQQSDAWKKAAQQQSRVLATAMRMMKGRHVSEADEKELAEASPDLYKLAKSAGAIEKIRQTQRQREEDQRISEANARERDWENEPRDYSTPPRSAYPTYETRITVDMSGGEPQVGSVGEVTIPPADG